MHKDTFKLHRSFYYKVRKAQVLLKISNWKRNQHSLRCFLFFSMFVLPSHKYFKFLWSFFLLIRLLFFYSRCRRCFFSRKEDLNFHFNLSAVTGNWVQFTIICSDVCAAERQLRDRVGGDIPSRQGERGRRDLGLGGLVAWWPGGGLCVKCTNVLRLQFVSADSTLRSRLQDPSDIQAARCLFGGHWRRAWGSAVSNWGGVTATERGMAERRHGNCNWCAGYWWH